MVVGSGLLAKRFEQYKQDDTCVVFASGVSNSTNKDDQEFEREQTLLTKTLSDNIDKTIVYFGTCSIYDSMLKNSPYVQHKLQMEELVRKKANAFHIFRISNLAGKTKNPHTILNFFASHILNGEPFQLWQESYRNIIDIDDAFMICDYIIQHKVFMNEVINVANPVNYPVIEIVHLLEERTGNKGKYTLVNRHSNPEIDISAISSIIAALNITFDASYLKRTIEKYFPVR